MRYTVINQTDGSFRVHAAKCADLAKPRNLGNGRFDVVVDDEIHANDPTEARRLVLADAWSDFVDEENTPESFEGKTVFLPCADLHRRTTTQEGPAMTTTAAPRFTTTAQVTQAIRAHMHVKTDELNMRTRIVGDDYVTSANPSAKYLKRTPDELAAMLVDWAGTVTTTEVGVRISTPVHPVVEEDQAVVDAPAELESEPVLDDVEHTDEPVDLRPSDEHLAEADMWREIDADVAFEEKFGRQTTVTAESDPDMFAVLTSALDAAIDAEGGDVEELGDGRPVVVETSAATVVRIEHDEDQADEVDEREPEIVHPSHVADQGEQVAVVELAERPNFVDRDEFPRADLLGVAEEDGVDVHPVLRLPLEPEFVPEFPTALDQPAPLPVDADMQYLTDRLTPGQVVFRPITTSANKTRTVAPCCGRYVPLPMSSGLYAPVACGWSCRLQYLVTKVDNGHGEQVARFVVLGPTLVVSQYYPGRGKK